MSRTAAAGQSAVTAQAAAISLSAEADPHRLIEVVVGAAENRDTNGHASPNRPSQLIEASLPGGVCLRLHGDVSATTVSQLAQALGRQSQPVSLQTQLSGATS